MTIRRLRRHVLGIAGLAGGLALAMAAPAAAEVNIPEGGAISPDSVFVINFQVQGGCGDLATDTLEVTIPEEVSNPTPEAVPGWDVEFETEGDRIALVRWSGSEVPPGTFFELAMRVGFPDTPGATIAFPVVQRCGVEEEVSAPSVVLQQRFGPRNILELDETVEANSVAIADLEERDSELAARADEQEERLRSLEETIDALGDFGFPVVPEEE